MPVWPTGHRGLAPSPMAVTDPDTGCRRRTAPDRRPGHPASRRNWAAGEDDRLRLAGEQLIHRGGIRDDFGVDVAFAHPARDQLRVLGAEVDDQNRVGVRYVRVNGMLPASGCAMRRPYAPKRYPASANRSQRRTIANAAQRSPGDGLSGSTERSGGDHRRSLRRSGSPRSTLRRSIVLRRSGWRPRLFRYQRHPKSCPPCRAYRPV